MIPTSARRRIVIKMLIDYSTGQVAPRRRIEKKATSQSSAKALLILWVQSDLAPVYCPSINRNNPEGETDKQTNKQTSGGSMCGGTDAGDGAELHSMQSPICNASEYTEELWRCFGDALEKHGV